MTCKNEAGAAVQPAAERAEEIFGRYPDISEEERRELLLFLKEGRHLDIGLVTGNPEIKDQVAAFRQDHHRALRLGFGEGAAFVILLTALLGGLFWLLAG